jgi:cell wall-associated NlpC family hydrolase
VAIAAAAGVLVLIPLLFGAGLLGTDDTTSSSMCGAQPAAAQPGVSTDAESGIPATYLRLYQQAGQQYGVPWNVLAAIGKRESDHGRDTSPGSGVRTGANPYGAAGPMQIGVGGKATNNWGGAPRHPASQKTGGVGVDGNGDGWADVHDPADAIPGAARYLLDHGAPGNLYQAVYAYNPDPDYVHGVLSLAAQYANGDFQPVADTGATIGACPGDVAAYTSIPGGIPAKVIAYAKAQLGKPYVYGAEGPDSFDCSGLTMMAYRAAGVSIPRTADAQYWHGKRIQPGTEQPGDMVFFDYKPGSSGPGHVGIVYNPANGTMIVAPHAGANVRYQSYKNYPGGPVGFTRPPSTG